MGRITLLAAACGAVLAAVVVPAAADSAPPTPTPTTASPAAGIVYPITSFLDWAESPIDNITDPALGVNAFAQTIDNAEYTVQHRFPDELDPTALLGPDGPALATAFSEEMASQLVHLRPQVAGDDATDQANPSYLPDFDHNGVYGDPGDYVSMISSTTGSGYFLYPCIADSGAVTYQTTGGSCAAPGTPGDTYLEGLAQRQTIVDARGLSLSATLWLPAQALRAGCPGSSPDTASCTAPDNLAPRSSLNGGRGLPAVVIADGIASSQSDYFWLAMTLARAGYVVLTYDPGGQGASEGSVADLFSPPVSDCEFSGACRDLQDVMRWLVGDPIVPVVDLATTTPLLAEAGTTPPSSSAAATPTNPDISNPAYQPQGANVVDPALGAIDTSRLAVAGHSMGALSLLNYLWFQGHGGKGADGNPLPRLTTGIALSGAAPTTATVPVQFQSSDYDGSPTLVGPAVGGVDFGAAGNGIGYADMKPLYDQLRTSGPGASALSLIVLEGGLHTDFIDTPFIPRTPWSLAVSAHYATAWLSCFLDDQFLSCLNAVVAIPHLSSSFASEATPPAGPLPHLSRCITIPTTASLDDSPTQLLTAEAGHPEFTCAR